MTAKGNTYKQSTAIRFSKLSHLILLCGHYGGFDQRILDHLVDENISIGNYVLTGGEIPAMIVTDSVTRLLEGVLGNDTSASADSFYNDDKTIQHPIYTRPFEYEVDGKILAVPDILISGNHSEIEKWRKDNTK
jgi:tRNA (guanine37-N1)-methyltransferase